MNWSHVPSPPGYSWLEGKLKKEYTRLVKLGEALEEKRKAADAIEPAELSADRSAWLRATIEALQTEIGLRDASVIFLAACNAAMQLNRQAAEEVKTAIENRERARLGLEEGCVLPLAAVQILPEWHAARKALDAIPNISDDGRYHHDPLNQARVELKKLQQSLQYEAARLEGFAAGDQREEKFRAELARRDAERRAPYDEQQSRVGALLK